MSSSREEFALLSQKLQLVDYLTPLGQYKLAWRSAIVIPCGNVAISQKRVQTR